MLRSKRLLLASHGTAGARCAEQVALSLGGPETTIYHLTVVPDFWKGMMGDDWLNNAATRDVYAKHVESELAREIERHQASLRAEIDARGMRHEPRVVLGKPTQCLIEYARVVVPDLVVMGSPRPRGRAGLRSRMHVEPLLRALCAPLLIVPFRAGA
jgi:nucleotide-binding universal stress UspA family protein